jgi:phosphopantetheinyl transferase (holo-ACP synthase)
MKAHHSRRLTYHDMVIRRPPDTEEGSQAPVAIILPRGKSGEQGWEEGQECKISISHDGDYATATCLAYEPAAGAADEISAGGKTG